MVIGLLIKVEKQKNIVGNPTIKAIKYYYLKLNTIVLVHLKNTKMRKLTFELYYLPVENFNKSYIIIPKRSLFLTL